jgi:hypothetical protein
MGMPWHYIKINWQTGCWGWTASLKGGGYGQWFSQGKPCYAHRAVYELLVGPIPDGMTLDHLCRIRHCVNPDHLEPVTRGENVRRGITGDVNSARLLATTHCKYGHEWDAENTHWGPSKVTRSGLTRVCRACKRSRARRQ